MVISCSSLKRRIAAQLLTLATFFCVATVSTYASVTIETTGETYGRLRGAAEEQVREYLAEYELPLTARYIQDEEDGPPLGYHALLEVSEDMFGGGPGNAETPFSVQRPLVLSRGSSLLLISAGVLVVVFAILSRKHYQLLKRIFDVVGSIAILSLFLPVIVIAAVAIKLDSTGPVLIKQVRVGLNRRNGIIGRSVRNERRADDSPGTLFTIYKLRTMRADAEASTGPVWARENDSRVTRMGKILRKSHLDEIPQFMNVLKGEMCIIGPRPERPVFIRKLNSMIRDYDKRLKVKPGITGLAQVEYKYAASIYDARIKLKYDLLYVRKMCLSMDLRILLNTFNTVLTTKGAR